MRLLTNPEPRAAEMTGQFVRALFLQLSTMRFALRLLVLITTVLGLGVAFAWAWDRSDARAQATLPAGQVPAPGSH